MAASVALQKPNATGKPRAQAKLVNVGLTDPLGWGEKNQLVRTSQL